MMENGASTDPTVMRAMLERWRNFEECILEDVGWRDYGTTLDFAFRYIWKDGTAVFRDDEEAPLVVMRLLQVHEFELLNALNEAQLRFPERLNWGYSEIAMVRLQPDSATPPESGAPRWQKLECLWEGRRHISVSFIAMEMEMIAPE